MITWTEPSPRLCARRARSHESSLKAARYTLVKCLVSRQIQTSYQRIVPVPLQKRRTVLLSKN